MKRKELDIYFVKTYNWLTHIWKGAQCHWLSVWCKSKPQWVSTFTPVRTGIMKKKIPGEDVGVKKKEC